MVGLTLPCILSVSAVILDFIQGKEVTEPFFYLCFVLIKPDTFSDIAETLNVKLKALSKYKDVMRAQPHPRSKEVLTGHAAYRGGQCSHLYAEAFQTVFRREI